MEKQIQWHEREITTGKIAIGPYHNDDGISLRFTNKDGDVNWLNLTEIGAKALVEIINDFYNE